VGASNRWLSSHDERVVLIAPLPPEKAGIANAILKWDGQDLDDLAAERNMIFALCRSREEWALHPQGELLASKPLIEIEKIADSEPEPFGPAERPLSGLFNCWLSRCCRSYCRVDPASPRRR